MKVVIISPFQFIYSRGIERYVFSLSNEMAKLGYNLTIYCWDKDTHFEWGHYHENIKIIKLKRFRYFNSIFMGIRYKFLISRDKPDFILINFLYHGEQFLPKNQKIFYTLHSPASQIKERYHFIKKIAPKFKNMKFIAVSKKVKLEAQKYLNNYSLKIIFNGVDTELFKYQANYTKPSNSIKIVSVAALEERKGIQYLIQALKEYKYPYHYTIYGTGSYKAVLDDLISKNNLQGHISILEPISNLNEVLSQYDIFALLSKGEAFPIAPLEAMSSGLPLLVSNYSPFPEFVNNKFGFLVDPYDTKEIHKILREISTNNELVKKMQKNARKEAEKFNWNSIALEYNSFFKNSL